MAQNKTYRCWYRDGSARLVSAKDHRSAALEAQELAGIANAPAPAKSNADEYRRYLDACKVARTECITPGDDSITRYK